MSNQQGQGIDIGDLSMEQLEQLRQQVTEETAMITNNLGNLRLAMNRYRHSRESIDDVEAKGNGGEILVPLTSSLYVPGKLCSTEVLVDVGTGYYVAKKPEAARAFLKRKEELVRKNTIKVEEAVRVKRQGLETITALLQRRAAERQQKLAAKQRTTQQQLTE